MAESPAGPALEPDEGTVAGGRAWGPLPAAYGPLAKRHHALYREDGERTAELPVGGTKARQQVAQIPAATRMVPPSWGAVAPAAGPPRAWRSDEDDDAPRTGSTIRHVDVLSVAKVSLVFYLIILAVVVIASIMLWYAADAFGTLHSIEKSVRTLFDLRSFTLHVAAVALYTCAGGGVLAVAGTLANVLAAVVYNLISDLVGGVKVDVE